MKEEIKNFLHSSSLQDDVVVSNFKSNSLTYTIVYMIQAVDIKRFNHEIKNEISTTNIHSLENTFLGLCSRITEITEKNLSYYLYSGKILLFSENDYYIFEYANKPKRSIDTSILDPEDPMASRDGFIEDLGDNITLIKRRIKTNDLITRKIQVGLIDKVDVAVLYLDSFHDKISLSKILYELNNINEPIVSINDISKQFEDDSLLPTVYSSSSPEIISGALLKGRICILLDNSPIVLVMPATLSTFTISKSYVNAPLYYSVFNHLFVTIFFLISVFFMGLFISIISFHRGSLSISLLANIQTTERGTNWPMFIEVILVYLLFEFYRFSTSRSTSNYIQNIIVILGGLFIGQNAIQSGTIGAIILFLTSISYIAVFAVTNNTYLITSINIFRFFILIMSFSMGLIGFLISSLITILYFFQKRNDTYYLYPFIPFDIKGLKNLFMPNRKLMKGTKR